MRGEVSRTNAVESSQKGSPTALARTNARFSVLLVEGRLREPLKTNVRHRVQTLLARGERAILLNLARVSDIDAAGIGELIRAYNMTTALGGVLQITHATRSVRHLLDVAGIFRLLSDPDG